MRGPSGDDNRRGVSLNNLPPSIAITTRGASSASMAQTHVPSFCKYNVSLSLTPVVGIEIILVESAPFSCAADSCQCRWDVFASSALLEPERTIVGQYLSMF